MQRLSMIFVAVALALTGVMIWISVKVGMPVWWLYDVGSGPSRAADILEVIFLVIALFLPVRRSGDALIALMLFAICLGVAATGLEGYISWGATQHSHVTDLLIKGPPIAGGILPLALAMIVAAVAAFRISRISRPGLEPAPPPIP